jgi:thiamine-monophosphate kinase
LFSKGDLKLKTNNKTKQAKSSGALGEHAIIQLMRKHFQPMPDVVVPFGDDVSAIPIPEGEVVVLKTDMLVAKTDVPRGMSLFQAARKAVVMNVSDFAAKGVQPNAVLVSLGLPKTLKRSDLEDIGEGLNAGAREYGAYVVGGDTGEACDLVVAVQLFGTSAKQGLMLRSGAHVDDVLAVTGLFGKSAAGLRLLQGGCEASPKVREVLVNAVCLPAARLREGLALRGSGAVSASIDSSDGLAWCLHELAVQSGVGFLVSGLPVAKEAAEFAEVNGLDVCELALYGGEEYELVVTVDSKRWVEAELAVAAVGGKLLAIGRATGEKRVLLEVDGERRLVEARGFEHFKGV